ncbi:PhzF family phenazine biosynthesis protein [Kitasatospora sp. LaBMicrA B282]|uniref:PhzF family phenazine biosynthesis protein n=1 Tax=Kitasatospora sp. LaBMicrA B282 TaxID=3420949 RepID=UPI003D14E983
MHSAPGVDIPGLQVLRVFTAPDGRFGNALGVVREGATVPEVAARQALARRAGFSETVFVDDPQRGTVDIYTPGGQLPFAGHPLIGVAHLLRCTELRLPVGTVGARHESDRTWITARPEWAPPRTLRRHADAAEVEALAVPAPGEWIYAWAWEDEQLGRVRARGFPGRGDGIDEDEATGAAALLLTHALGRPLTITQGSGSVIHTAPRADGSIEIGGRVTVPESPAADA